jgi:hypothetical protein
VDAWAVGGVTEGHAFGKSKAAAPAIVVILHPRRFRRWHEFRQSSIVPASGNATSV